MALTGIAVSPGSASGPTFVLVDTPAAPPVVATGMEGVREAMAHTAAQLEELATRVRPRNPEGADVLDAQALLIRDQAVQPEIQHAVWAGKDPVTAVREAYEGHAARLEALGDSYVGARAADVREAGRAVVDTLTGRQPARLAGLTQPAIVVAHDLSSAEVLGAAPQLLLGIVTEAGGAASHAAIVARELGVPAVFGVRGAVAAAAGARSATVDGGSGTVRFSTLPGVTAERAVTGGEASVECWLPLLTNAGTVRAAASGARRGARGVGLLRTEMFYLGRRRAPTRREQATVLGEVCEVMAPHPVHVRTLDAGSDKELPYLARRPGSKAGPGSRGVRLWLAHPALGLTQTRAILEAYAEHPNLRVMLPMVAVRGEVEEARAIFQREARALGLVVPPLGIMIETPAAAASVTSFEGLVEFISLGTNDLAHYAAGADRERSGPEELHDWNPGTLRLIQRALSDARSLGIEAGVCGELAGRPAGAVLLAGLGATSLSMNPDALEGVAEALGNLGPVGCTEAARTALGKRTAAEARAAVVSRVAQAAGEARGVEPPGATVRPRQTSAR